MSDPYQEKKKLIKRCALKVFARYGYNKTTLDDIAGQLGIKKNSLYYYFKNKEALFSAIVSDEVNNLIDELIKISSAEMPVRKKIMAAVHKLLYFGQERSSIYSISMETFLEIGEVINQSFAEIKRRIQRIFVDMLKAGIKNGELKKHNADIIAEYLLDTLRAFEYREYYSRRNVALISEIDLKYVESRIKILFGLILDGLERS